MGQRLNSTIDAIRQKDVQTKKLKQEAIKLQQEQEKLQIEKETREREANLREKEFERLKKNDEIQQRQRKQDIERTQDTIKQFSVQIMKDQEEMRKIQDELKCTDGELLKLKDEIDKFDHQKKLELKALKDEMKEAKDEEAKCDETINGAILKTGQHKDDVPRFLRLINGLIGESTQSQINANRLDAEFNTFQIMFQRQCQDKLTIESYFREQNLDRFVPILAKKGFKACQDLACDNVDEFKRDILEYVEGEFDESVKESNHEFDAFLAQYKLTKYKQAFKNADLESLEDINEDLDDETIEEIISEADIKGLGKKKFKRAIKDVQSGKYKPRSASHNDEVDIKENQQESQPVTEVEKKALMRISTKPETWKQYETERADQIKATLLKISPILSDFFNQTHEAVKQAQKLLEMPNMDGRLNDQQMAVMVSFLDNTEQKAIELNDDKPTTDIKINNGGPFDMKYTAGSNWPFESTSSGSTENSQESQLSFTIAGQYQYGDDTVSFAISLDAQSNILLSVVRGTYQQALDKLEAGPQRISASSWQATIESYIPDTSSGAKYGVAIIIDAPQDEEKSATDVVNVNNPAPIEDEYEQPEDWTVGSAVQVYSKTLDRWYDGKIIEIINDDEGEWLKIEYTTGKDKRTKQVDRYGPDVRDPLMVECKAISKAVVDLHIVDDAFRDRLEENEITKLGLPVATGIEGSIIALMKCQSDIRQSVRLAEHLFKSKPPLDANDKAKPLWDVIDQGIVQILKNTVEIHKTSAQFFSYFLRFNQSFQTFVAMNEQNKDVSLFTSLDGIKQDLTDFTEFKKKFNQSVRELGKSARGVLEGCVRQAVGVDHFEKAQKLKEESINKYLKAAREHTEKELDLEDKLHALKIKRTTYTMQKNRLQHRIESLNKQMAQTEGYIAKYREKELKLMNTESINNNDNNSRSHSYYYAQNVNMK